MTTFSALTTACGLSLREASEVVKVRLDTVKSWSSGRNNCPVSVLAELSDLRDRIEEAADAAISDILDAVPRPESVEIGLASDDAEARSIGWPCVGVHRMLLGCVASGLIVAQIAVRIVPRGSAMLTAAAADENDLISTE